MASPLSNTSQSNASTPTIQNQEVVYVERNVTTTLQDGSSKSYQFSCPSDLKPAIIASALRIIEFHICFKMGSEQAEAFKLEISSNEQEDIEKTSICLLSNFQSNAKNQTQTAVISFLGLGTNESSDLESPLRAFYNIEPKGEACVRIMAERFDKLRGHSFLPLPTVKFISSFRRSEHTTLLSTPPQFSFFHLLVLQNCPLNNLSEAAKLTVETEMPEFLERRDKPLTTHETFQVFKKLAEGFIEVQNRGFLLHQLSFYDLAIDLVEMQPYLGTLETLLEEKEAQSTKQSRTTSRDSGTLGRARLEETSEQKSVKILGQLFFLLTGECTKYIGEILAGRTGIEVRKEFNWERMKDEVTCAIKQNSHSAKVAVKNTSKGLPRTHSVLKPQTYSSKSTLMTNMLKLIETMLRNTPNNRPELKKIPIELAEIERKEEKRAQTEGASGGN